MTEDDDTVVMAFSLPSSFRERGAELTAAESIVLGELLRGLKSKEIAARRGASVRTIANQIASIFRKLGVSSRAELVTSAALFAVGRKRSPPSGRA